MGMTRVDQYGSDGRLRLEAWSIYAAFASAGAGAGLIKIGISTRPLHRIYQVHCGSPFAIEAAIWSWVGRKGEALSVERTIKSRLAERQTRGEWFEFDFANPTDKELFHGVTKTAYARATGRRLVWTRTTIAQAKEAVGIDWHTHA